MTRFFIYYTGTQGQAEWIKTFSIALKDDSKIISVKKNLSNLPSGLRPLATIEQPDLIISTKDNKPLLSIEITEQQAFGTNSQQRIGRFWSAALNKIPSAYLLPLESYQIEKTTSKSIKEDKDNTKLERIPDKYKFTVVGNYSYKAYIRSPKKTEGMVIKFFDICSTALGVPTFLFKIQSDIKLLFRTSGIPHIIEDKMNPNLSFRNLPPRPGQTPVVYENKNISKDEISLFFNFIDDVLFEKKIIPEEYAREQILENYVRKGSDNIFYKDITSNVDQFDSSVSGDYLVDTKNFGKKFGIDLDNNLPSKSFVVKVKCGGTRPLADPYTGTLALRDIYFCKNKLKNIDSLAKRNFGLIFFVSFEKKGVDHLFLSGLISKYYIKNLDNGARTPQEMLIEILGVKYLRELPKDFRGHILFSDIIVTRKGNKIEFIEGVPLLLRKKLIDDSIIKKSLLCN